MQFCVFFIFMFSYWLHYQEKMCEESTSFDLTPYDLISAIEAVDRLLRERASDISKADSAEDFNVESLNSG